MGIPIFPVTRVCDMGTPLPSPVFMTWGPLCRQHVDNNGLHVHRVRVPIVFEIWRKKTPANYKAYNSSGVSESLQIWDSMLKLKSQLFPDR